MAWIVFQPDKSSAKSVMVPIGGTPRVFQYGVPTQVPDAIAGRLLLKSGHKFKESSAPGPGFVVPPPPPAPKMAPTAWRPRRRSQVIADAVAAGLPAPTN